MARLPFSMAEVGRGDKKGMVQCQTWDENDNEALYTL